MIIREETNLTQSEYDALASHEGPALLQAQLYIEAPYFRGHSNPGLADDHYFDVAIKNGVVRRAYISGGYLRVQTLPDEQSSLLPWNSYVTLDSGVDQASISFGDPDTIFYQRGGDLYRVQTTDDWATGGTPELIYSLSGAGALFVAGVAADTVYLCVSVADGNYNFLRVKYIGTWTTTNSGIYWAHTPTGFDAVRRSDGRDVVILSSDLPYQFSTVTDNVNVQTIMIRRNGLLAFVVNNGRWSEHYMVETFDEASGYQYRSHARASITQVDGEDRLIVTAHGYNGTSRGSLAGIYYYFSSDGRYWSQPEYAFITDHNHGAQFVVNGRITHLISQSTNSYLFTTSAFGTPASENIEDITDRIVSFSSSQAGGRQSTLVLRNDDGWIDMLDALLFDTKVRYRVGNIVNGVPVVTDYSFEIAEVMTPSQSEADHLIVIKSRDYSANLNTYKKAPHTRWHDGQTVGFDTFDDQSGTGYGGLRHTSTIKGSFETQDNWLKIKGSNDIAIGASTFDTSVWNGVIQSAIQVTDALDGFAGLVFRLLNNSNYMSVEWVLDENAIVMYDVRGGTKTELGRYNNIGWGINNTYYLRVFAHYQHIFVETSNDGKTWTSRFDVIVPATTEYVVGVDTVETAAFEEGAFGVTGWGYSPQPAWVGEVPTYQPPTFTTPQLPSFDPVRFNGMTENAVTIGVFAGNGFYVTDNFNETPGFPTWYEKAAFSTADHFLDFVVDAYTPGYNADIPGTEVNGWALAQLASTGNYAIVKLTDIFGTPSIAIQKDLGSGAGRATMDFGWGVQNWGICAVNDASGTLCTVKIYYTTDGINWNGPVSVGDTIDAVNTSSIYYMSKPGLYVSSKTPGYAVVIAWNASVGGVAYKTTDYGASWSKDTSLFWPDSGGWNPNAYSLGPIHFPYGVEGEATTFGSHHHTVCQIWRSDGGVGSMTPVSHLGDNYAPGLAYSRWTLASHPAYPDMLAFVGCNNYTIKTGYFGMWYSVNGGDTWELLTTPQLHDYPTSDGPQGLAFAGDGQVLFHWKKEKLGRMEYNAGAWSGVDRTGNLDSFFGAADYICAIVGGPTV